MKLALILGLQLLALTSHASELLTGDSELVNNYVVKVKAGEKITVEIIGDEHFSCWKNFTFKNLRMNRISLC